MNASQMKVFYGTKTVFAIPMTRGAYNQYRGWDIPADEDPNDAGYLVEYKDGGKPNHKNHNGYISWSPSDVFETSYQDTENLSFGHAVEALKYGLKVTRSGWNGKGMFLYYVDADQYPAKSGVAIEHFKKPDAPNSVSLPMVPYRAYIAMKTAQGDVVPWVASQSDILADDWQIVA